MSDRVKAGYSLSRESMKRLSRLQKATGIPKSRLIDESINLLHLIRFSPTPIVCAVTPTGVKTSEITQEPNHD